MNPTTEQPPPTRPAATLAICIRNRVAAVALVIGGMVERVWRRHFAFAKGRSRLDYLADLLRRLTADHAIDTVVVEPGSIAERAAEMVGLLTRIIHLDEAKARLISISSGPVTHTHLVETLVSRHPNLVQYVTVLRSGAVAVAPSRRWQTVAVLAAALGLAHATPRPANAI